MVGKKIGNGHVNEILMNNWPAKPVANSFNYKIVVLVYSLYGIIQTFFNVTEAPFFTVLVLYDYILVFRKSMFL